MLCFDDHCLSFCPLSFGPCVVCSSSIYGSWLPLWYLLIFVHCIVCPSIYKLWLSIWYLLTFDNCIVYSSIYGFWLPLLVSSTFWPLHCLSFNLQNLFTPLVSLSFLPVCCLSFFNLRILIIFLLAWSINCCLTPTLAVVQLYCGVITLWVSSNSFSYK